MNYENINIKIIDNKIENLDKLISYIDSLEYDFNANEYLESLVNNLRFAEYINKSELIKSIEAKLLEFKLYLAEQDFENNLSNNENALKVLQEQNQDMTHLKIVRTTKDDNDSKRDIDYLVYTHDDGRVEMLVCENENTLNDYIKAHSKDIISKSAYDIFTYFRDYIHRELHFENIDEKEQADNDALVREAETLKIEEEALEKFKIDNNISGNIEMTIDRFGERIYKIADYVLKFKTVNEARQMIVLSSPVEEIKTEDLLEELETDQKEDDVLASQEQIDTPEEPLIQEEIYELDMNDFHEIMVKRDVYEIELTASELHRLESYIGILLDTMYRRADAHDLDSDEQKSLDDYMSHIMYKYDDIKNGIEDISILSERDYEYACRYDEFLKYVKEQGLDKPIGPLKELNDPEKNNGIASILILAEIATIGGLIAMILSLA